MEWKCKDVVLGTYEIENAIWNNYYLHYVDRHYSYVDTSICYNNDLHLKELLRNKYIKVISKIPPQMLVHYGYMMNNHLRCLGRKKIDIMLIHNGRSEDWKDLAKLLKEDDRVVSTGVSNFTINQLEEYKSIIGEYPEYNEMEINPNYYDKELIEFCHKNNIKIIAYAILGGKYNARRNIATYTLPYLLEFVGRVADLIITRSDSYIRLEMMRHYLIDHKEFDPQYNEVIFDMESNISSKSINPTSYSHPMYYTRSYYPTNYDFVPYLQGFSICRGFIHNDSDSTDALNINSMMMEEAKSRYEFVSDLRVLARYILDNYMHDTYKKWPKGDYTVPSIYMAHIMKKRWFRKDKIVTSHLVALNLLTDDGNLTKVNNGKCRIVIESK